MEKNKAIILLPHYNNPEGLIRSLDSLKNERGFDLLIIDDGSDRQEEIREIIERYASYYTIETVFQTRNAGITQTLNHGLKHIQSLGKYDYVARLDAGDICINERIQKQIAYLDRHDDVHLLGSWVDYVDVNGKKMFTLKYPTAHKSIKDKVFLFNPFNHPAVMYRTESISEIGYYPDNYPALEDHAYFFKFIKKFKTANLPEVLLLYEVNPNGISLSRRKVQVTSRLKLLRDNFEFGFYPICGILRNLFTFILPPGFLVKVKSVLFGK